MDAVLSKLLETDFVHLVVELEHCHEEKWHQKACVEEKAWMSKGMKLSHAARRPYSASGEISQTHSSVQIVF